MAHPPRKNWPIRLCWPLWRTTNHITTSVWKMSPSWHWTDHSGGYWQQVELRTEMMCTNDDDDKNVTLAGARCRLKIFFRDSPFTHRIFMKLWCSPSNINFNKKNTSFHVGPQILFST